MTKSQAGSPFSSDVMAMNASRSEPIHSNLADPGISVSRLSRNDEPVMVRVQSPIRSSRRASASFFMHAILALVELLQTQDVAQPE